MLSDRRVKVDAHMLSEYRDEIYGASILWIMLFHGFLCKVVYFKDVPVLQYFGRFLTYGNMGVEVFLFLSGVCLYFSYHDKQAPVPFIRKRIQRIFPALFLICMPYWILLYVHGEITMSKILFSLSTLRFWFTSANQNWFISLILVCYLFYPYFYGILFEKEKGAFPRTLILLGSVVLITMLIRKDSSDNYKNIEIALTRMPVFILGCWFGKAVYEKKTFPGRVLRFLGGISLELYLMHLILKNVYQKGYLFSYVPGSTKRWLAVLMISVVLSFIVSKLVSAVKNLPRSRVSG